MGGIQEFSWPLVCFWCVKLQIFEKGFTVKVSRKKKLRAMADLDSLFYVVPGHLFHSRAFNPNRETMNETNVAGSTVNVKGE